MKRNWIVAAIALLAVAAGAWYAFSPQWTLWQIRQAAEARDAEELSAYVDYPKVRESMKSQLKAAMAAKMMESGSNGFEAIGMAIGMQMMDPMIDAMISPEGLQAGFARAAKADQQAGKKAAPFALGEDDSYRIERDGIDAFRVVIEDPGKEATFLKFERRGLGWVLAGVQLPAPKL